MNILAFDTSNQHCSAALWYKNQLFYQQQFAPMQQAQLILPMIKTLMDESKCSLNEIHAIAYVPGPGSFTGIRLGSSVAQGLAFLHRTPIIHVSSLKAYALSAAKIYEKTQFLIAIDARMGDIYYGEYQLKNDKVEAIFPDKLCKPTEINLSSEQLNCIGIGDAWEIYRVELQLNHHHLQIDAKLPIDIKAVLTLAKDQFRNDDYLTLDAAFPVYLR